MRHTEVIVLGQGLAGTLMSWRLRSAGIAHVVLCRGHKLASSMAAAGIVNPVTGRRFVKSWHIDALLPMLSVYTELEEALGVRLLHPLTVLRDLGTPEALNQWDMRRQQPEYADYLDAPITNLSDVSATDTSFKDLNLPPVVGPTVGAYRVDLPTLLTAYRAFIGNSGKLVELEASIDEAEQVDARWTLAGITATSIIDCTGAAAANTQMWGALPWRGTKGEALRLCLPTWPRAFAAKRRAFVCPLGDTDEVWLGATNDDHSTDHEPSAAARAELEEQANSFGVSLPNDAVPLVGIRPTTRDRRPLVGEHPERRGIFLCNGLGTKGASLAPLCTQQLLDLMIHKTALLSELDIAGRMQVG